MKMMDYMVYNVRGLVTRLRGQVKRTLAAKTTCDTGKSKINRGSVYFFSLSDSTQTRPRGKDTERELGGRLCYGEPIYGACHLPEYVQYSVQGGRESIVSQRRVTHSHKGLWESHDEHEDVVATSHTLLLRDEHLWFFSKNCNNITQVLQSNTSQMVEIRGKRQSDAIKRVLDHQLPAFILNDPFMGRRGGSSNLFK